MPTSSGAKCPNCGSEKLRYTEEDVVCEECGCVIGEGFADPGPEWRPFEKEERSRVGAPDFYHLGSDSLKTKFQWRPEYPRLFCRLAKLQDRFEDRSLVGAIHIMQNIRDKLCLPQPVLERAIVIFKRAEEEGLLRGRSVLAGSIACVYAACRVLRVPVTLDELYFSLFPSFLFDRSVRKEVRRFFLCLVKRGIVRARPFSPEDFVQKIVDRLRKGPDVAEVALKILKSMREKRAGKMSNGAPNGWAAAAVYIACRLCGEDVLQREVVDAAMITNVTLRHRVEDLKSVLDAVDYEGC